MVTFGQLQGMTREELLHLRKEVKKKSVKDSHEFTLYVIDNLLAMRKEDVLEKLKKGS